VFLLSRRICDGPRKCRVEQAVAAREGENYFKKIIERPGISKNILTVWPLISIEGIKLSSIVSIPKN